MYPNSYNPADKNLFPRFYVLNSYFAQMISRYIYIFCQFDSQQGSALSVHTVMEYKCIHDKKYFARSGVKQN